MNKPQTFSNAVTLFLKVVSCFLYESTIKNFFLAVCYKTAVCRRYYYYYYGGASFMLEPVNRERINLKKKE